MLQLILLFAISWLLIWLFEKKHLIVLGLFPTLKRLSIASLLLVVSMMFAASGSLLRMLIAKETFALTTPFHFETALLEVWNQLRTVLTEELLCRGALLYILIRRIGQTKALLVSSILFAALHWLNAGVWGDLTQMAIVFAYTFAMGMLLSFAYVRTYSLWMPFAIHFGWNLTQNYIFPGNTAGNHMFVLASPPPEVTISYAAFYFMTLFPKLAVLIVNYLILRRQPKVKTP